MNFFLGRTFCQVFYGSGHSDSSATKRKSAKPARASLARSGRHRERPGGVAARADSTRYRKSNSQNFFNAGNRRHKGACTRNNDDAARSQTLGFPVAIGDVHLPGGDDPGCSLAHVDTEVGVTLGRVMRFNGLDDRLHTLHHLGKTELSAGCGDAEFPGSCHVGKQLGRTDQRLGGNTLGIQAVTTELVLFYQRDLGFDGRRNVRRHQSSAAPPR